MTNFWHSLIAIWHIADNRGSELGRILACSRAFIEQRYGRLVFKDGRSRLDDHVLASHDTPYIIRRHNKRMNKFLFVARARRKLRERFTITL